jgi:hypothetical protein
MGEVVEGEGGGGRERGIMKGEGVRGRRECEGGGGEKYIKGGETRAEGSKVFLYTSN